MPSPSESVGNVVVVVDEVVVVVVEVVVVVVVVLVVVEVVVVVVVVLVVEVVVVVVVACTVIFFAKPLFHSSYSSISLAGSAKTVSIWVPSVAVQAPFISMTPWGSSWLTDEFDPT